MNITAYAPAVEFVTVRPGAVRVKDMATGRIVGFAEKRRGFIEYTGERRTAHEGVFAVIRSTDSTFSALEAALVSGLKSGRDDHAPA